MWEFTKKVARIVEKELVKEIKQTNKKNKSNQHGAGVKGESSRLQVVERPADPVLLPHPWPVPPIALEPWNVIKMKKKIDAVVSSVADIVSVGSVQPSMQVEYVPGVAGSSSGFGFYAAPCHAFPSAEAKFSYKVYFPETFDWVKGGKLPGIFIGAPGATGGNWEPESGSVRMVWQRGGHAALYLYLPTQISSKRTKEGAIAAQGPKFRKHSHVTEKGCHVWRRGFFKLNRGAWNDVTLYVKLNTVGRNDGIIQVEVNGTKDVLDDMLLRADATVLLGGISIQTFYGGHRKDCACPVTGSYAKFREFKV